MGSPLIFEIICILKLVLVGSSNASKSIVMDASECQMHTSLLLGGSRRTLIDSQLNHFIQMNKQDYDQHQLTSPLWGEIGVRRTDRNNDDE